jgi:hypothetical protein
MSKDQKSNKEARKVPLVIAKKEECCEESEEKQKGPHGPMIRPRLALVFAVRQPPIVLPRGTKRLSADLRPTGNTGNSRECREG